MFFSSQPLTLSLPPTTTDKPDMYYFIGIESHYSSTLNITVTSDMEYSTTKLSETTCHFSTEAPTCTILLKPRGALFQSLFVDPLPRSDMNLFEPFLSEPNSHGKSSIRNGSDMEWEISALVCEDRESDR